MLKHKVEIYVPMNTSKQEGVLRDVFQRFCKEFGGAIVNPVLGGWMDDKGALITDKIGIVYYYVPYVTQENRKLLKKIAVEIRETLKEDAITVVINGEVDFY